MTRSQSQMTSNVKGADQNVVPVDVSLEDPVIDAVLSSREINQCCQRAQEQFNKDKKKTKEVGYCNQQSFELFSPGDNLGVWYVPTSPQASMTSGHLDKRVRRLRFEGKATSGPFEATQYAVNNIMYHVSRLWSELLKHYPGKNNFVKEHSIQNKIWKYVMQYQRKKSTREVVVVVPYYRVHFTREEFTKYLGNTKCINNFMKIINIFLKNHTQLDVNKLIYYYGEKETTPHIPT